MALEKRTLAWVDKGEILNGSFQHKSILIDNVCISVGDSVTVNTANDESIGLIKELYECPFSRDKNVRLLWYMTDTEIQNTYYKEIEAQVTFQNNELVLTDKEAKLVSVESIINRVAVTPAQSSNSSTSTRNSDYTCNWLLNTKTCTLHSITDTFMENLLTVVMDPPSLRRKSKLVALGKMTDMLKHGGYSRIQRTPETTPRGHSVSQTSLVKVRRSFRNIHNGVFVSSDEESMTEEETFSPPPVKKRKIHPRRNVTLPSSRTRSRGAIRKKEIATSIPTRISRVQSSKGQQEQYESLKERLHVSTIPHSLPCREDQFANIMSFVEGKLLQNGSGCMYISGVPGTGKTATVLEVSRLLQEAAAAGDIPPFKFIEINGLRLTEPRQAYVSILKQLTGEKTTADKAATILDNYFCSPVRRKKGQQRESILLLADELDYLWTRKQSVLYNLFDWPSNSSSRLIVIAVANKMDLPERLMMTKVSSRLGLTRLTFNPYNFNQLKDIISARLTGLKIFDQDATEMAARKVASVTGDARRALDVCRRAVEIAQRTNQEKRSPSKGKRSQKMLTPHVGMVHVTAAVSEMFSSPMVTAIRSCSMYQKLFLQALDAQLKRTDQEVTTLSLVYCELVEICRIKGHSPPSVSQAISISTILSSMRIIIVESGCGDINRKVRLNVTQDDIYYALKDTN